MKDNSISLTTHDGASTSKSKSSRKGKGKFNLKVKDGGVCKEKKCYFCKERVYFEVPNNTWWLDSGATTHMSHIM